MSIIRYYSFLEQELLEECISYSKEQFTKKSFTFTNHAKWDKNIVLDSAVVYVHVVPTYHPIMTKLSDAIKDKLQMTPKSQSVMFYYWMPGSHIPWHNDLGFEAGLTIYLNKKWNRNQGGLFLYEDNGICALVPTVNEAVFQQGGIMHAVSATTLFSEVRTTIQVFLT